MRRPHFLLLAAAVLIFLTACGRKNDSVVNTDGSTAMERVMGALIEGFRGKETDIIINYSGTGSGAGIEAVLSGVCDIGLSSRTLNDTELQKGAVAHLVALDAISVIVNTKNPVRNLTTQQLRLIFSGIITNWAQIGGPDAPIAVYGREAGSGTRSAFEETLGIGGRCSYTNEYSSTGDIVGNVSTNPNGIGYVSLSGVRGGVSILQINGIVCSEDTVRSGSYILRRPFLLVTDARRPLSDAARAFLTYALSAEAADVISVAGAIAPTSSKG